MEGIQKPNEYLKSVLNPEYGPRSIPDDNVKRHVNRTETITYNITAVDDSNHNAPVSGILIFYPNTPSSLIGVYYRFSNTSQTYLFDTVIFTAQQLSESYNYARKTAGVMHVRSATLPSGVYALTGTFNAATYEGAPSEVGIPSYNHVLQVTSNPMDKVGNVLVGSGITVLTLPASYDIPYMRLQDPSPASAGGAARIRDSQQNLAYTWAFSYATPLTSTTMIQIGTVNCDSNTVVSIIANLQLSVVISSTQSTAVPLVYNFQFSALDLTGAVVGVVCFSQFTYNIPAGTTAGTFTPGEIIAGTLPIGANFLNRPIAAVAFSYQLVTPTTIPAGIVVTLNPLQTEITAHSAAMPGTQYPISIVAFEGVASGTVISIAGVANFELVPNPMLARNLVTYYGSPNSHEMDYLKTIMANRDRLGIRSVWKTSDYYDMKNTLFEELLVPQIVREKYHIEAFDWGKLFKIGAQLLPGISDAIIPGSGNLVGGIAQGLSGLMSASGTPISASGMPIAASGQPVGQTVAQNVGVLQAAGGKPVYRRRKNNISNNMVY